MTNAEKVAILGEILKKETSVPETDQHGVMLEYWQMTDKPISLDIGAIRLLCNYYSHKATVDGFDPKMQLQSLRNEYLFNVINSH